MVTTDTTWAERLNGALDEISRRDKDRQTALDALTNLTRRHPDLDTDPDLTVARLILLR